MSLTNRLCNSAANHVGAESPNHSEFWGATNGRRQNLPGPVTNSAQAQNAHSRLRLPFVDLQEGPNHARRQIGSDPWLSGGALLSSMVNPLGNG